MKLNRRGGSQPRRAVGSEGEDLQPKLFDVQPAPADQPDIAPVPHPQQPGEAKPVDLSGATEYGLGPAQLPLFEAMEPVQDGEGVKAVDREGDAPREGSSDSLVTRGQQDADEEDESPTNGRGVNDIRLLEPEDEALLDRLATLLLADLGKQEPPS